MTLLQPAAVEFSEADEGIKSPFNPPFPKGEIGGFGSKKQLAQARIEAAYREHYDAVRRLLRNRLDNEDDVAELAQETYLRVLRYRDCNSDSLKRLLLRVAMNLAVSHRRQACHAKAHVPIDDVELAASEPSAEEVYEREERLERTLSAVWKLPNRCREVFTLSRLDGIRHRDIARRYGISLRLVEKQITQAKAAIREVGS